MSTIFTLAGLGSMSTTNMLFMTFVILIACVLTGWLTDFLLKRHGFGPIGNSALLFVSSFAGMIAYSQLFRPIRMEYSFIAVAVTVAMAYLGLMILVMLRKLLLR